MERPHVVQGVAALELSIVSHDLPQQMEFVQLSWKCGRKIILSEQTAQTCRLKSEAKRGYLARSCCCSFIWKTILLRGFAVMSIKLILNLTVTKRDRQIDRQRERERLHLLTDSEIVRVHHFICQDQMSPDVCRRCQPISAYTHMNTHTHNSYRHFFMCTLTLSTSTHNLMQS